MSRRPSRTLQLAPALLIALGAASIAAQGVAPRHGYDVEHPDVDSRVFEPGSDDEIERVGRAAVRLLEARCVECHDEQRTDGDLRLDSREGLLAGGDSGPAVILGSPGESELVYRITSELGFDRMPYEQTPLGPTEIETLSRWIELGAPWPDSFDASVQHWGFRPLADAPPPKIEGATTDIDRFVLARLAERGVEPSERATPRTLVRRLFLDLHGLPPDPAVVERFAADPSDAAWSALVDELLASPHFAERWARHWLDRARYADSDGYEKDEARPQAWLFRDWVIDAIDRDVPWDRFTIEQIAGDLVPEATWHTRLGTAFHRQTLTNKEGGADPEEFRVHAVLDRVNTVATTWLGLTAGCAQCHDHKYEPMSQAEYFQLYAFFENTDEIEEPLPLRAARRETWFDGQHPWEVRRAELLGELAAARKQVPDDVAQWLPGERERVAALTQRLTHRAVHPASIESTDGDVRRTDVSALLLPPPARDESFTEFTFEGPLDEAHGLRVRLVTSPLIETGGPGHGAKGTAWISALDMAVRQTDDTLRVVSFSHGRSEPPVLQGNEAALFDLSDETSWKAPGGRDTDLLLFAREPFHVAEGERLVVRMRSVHDERRVPGLLAFDLIDAPDPVDVPADAYRALLAPPRTKFGTKLRAALRSHRVEQHPIVRTAHAAIADHDAQRPDVPHLSGSVVVERTEDRRPTHVFDRGDFLSPADPVEPGVLAVLTPLVPRNPESGADRLDLAHWLVSDDNALARRVAVNQIWQRLFGAGIVSTIDDFGLRGEAPSHPLLLDRLARRFGELGLSRKALIREIVLSETYRRSSHTRLDLVDVDPANRLLARQNRYRVEAEIVRDLALATAGLLDTEIGGPSVFPPMDASVAEQSYADLFSWTTSEGGDRYRRGMYTFFKRTALHPNLAAFDCPTANVTAASRARSNTPIQALATLNNEVFVEAAVGLAVRLLRESRVAEDRTLLERGFTLSVARPPTGQELEALMELAAAAREHYDAHPEDVEELLAVVPGGLEGLPIGSTPAERARIAALTTVCRVLLNTDEFLTRE